MHLEIVYLAPFALVAAAFLLLMLVLAVWVILANIKDWYLLHYGVKTEALIIEAVEYTGTGDHAGDPCFRGHYSFTDRRGRIHLVRFRDHCYDPYHIVSSRGSMKVVRDQYQPGTRIPLRYVRWAPHIHSLYDHASFSSDESHEQ